MPFWSNPNQTLAENVATIKTSDRTGSVLDSVENVLPMADLSSTYPALELPQRLGKSLGIVKDEEALHSRTLDEKMTLDAWPLGYRVPIGDRRRAADHHSGSHVETAHDGIADSAGSVVEVDADTPRARSIEPRLEIVGLVVHGRVVTELLAADPHFVRAAGDAGSAAASDFGDLTGTRPNRPRCGGNDYGLPGLRLAHVEQGEIGRQAVKAEDTERCRDGQANLDDLALDRLGVDSRVVLPAEHSGDIVARAEVGMS